ncbi:helix-turn-helix protein [Amycolatopsis cihanbeyliensis]|uniref:Helix-turn-helix protein n=2 Tax=Amycolatopsis cihanbeyliensis TaxID=1128664 RepID=A0A542DM87_AMYCI|nr:helix-turn-helix protein [Amycolatopsis cihanbeyliensis]
MRLVSGGMTTSLGPGVRRRVLGKRLRKLREKRGMTTTTVSKRMKMAQPSLSRIENGRNAILTEHVYKLCEIYGASKAETTRLIRLSEQSRERGWWESYSDVISDWFEIYASLESDAERILLYESEFVPGMFQTPGYIRAVYRAAHPEAGDEAANRAVDLRVARQLRLEDRSITALINEGAVRRVVGGSSVMLDQVRHLIDVIERQHADIRIMPFAAGAHAAMSGPFNLLKFPDANEIDLVYVENERGGMYFERPEDLARYTDIFDRALGLALAPEESVALLGKIGEEY